MAAHNRPSVLKRAREALRQDKKMQKAAKKVQSEAEKAERRAAREDGVDPDIAGIIPGPQPPRED